MRKPSRLKAYTSEVNKARKLRREAGKLVEKAIELEVKAKYKYLDKCSKCHGSGSAGEVDPIISLPGVPGRRVVASS